MLVMFGWDFGSDPGVCTSCKLDQTTPLFSHGLLFRGVRDTVDGVDYRVRIRERNLMAGAR